MASFIRHWLSYVDSPTDYEKVSKLPSMTVPDQSMTIAQILNRYTAGQPVDGYDPLYDIPDEVSDSEAFGFTVDEDNPDVLTAQQDLEDEIRESERQRNERRPRKSQTDTAPGGEPPKESAPVNETT